MAFGGACGGARVERIAGRTMGSTYEVKWRANGGATLLPATMQANIEALLARVNAAFSTWDDASVISRFNAHASTDPFVIPDEHRAAFVSVMQVAREVAERSDGAFDPTVLPLVDLRGFGKDGEREPPSVAERAAALAHVGWRKVWLDEQDRLCKAEPLVRITFSALVPGWAADRLADLLQTAGAGDCMMDVDGEIVCRGTKADGAPWTIGIERPCRSDEPSRVHTTLSFTGGLATSGTYRNAHLEGDHVVHHLLDPHTGDNVRHPWASVSVVADSAGLADALATAFMVVGPDRAESIVNSYADRGVRALFLSPPDADGRIGERRLRWLP